MDIDYEEPKTIKYICINCCEARHETDYYYHFINQEDNKNKICDYCVKHTLINKVEMKTKIIKKYI